ncbi:MAG: hypothetical protein ACO4AL_08390 [Steroidobacteraceae bacterium]
MTTYVLLKWAHIVAMVYWLGGEWGVFQTSYHVTNPRLSLEERRRHLETAYRIDILARTGIVLLFPLGFHMGAVAYNAHPWGDDIPLVWVIMLSWLALTWAAFFKRETDLGIRLTRIDESLRYVFIPLLLGVSLWSLLGDGPLTVTWYAAKVFIYSLLLIIGLILRFVMRHWTIIFREIAIQGPTPALEGQLAREISIARMLAYVYWIGIGTVAMFGVAKAPW